MKTYLECISVENMRESDRLTIERYVSGRTLMYRAALGVYRAVNWRGDIAIAVGGGLPSNNTPALLRIPEQSGGVGRIVLCSHHGLSSQPPAAWVVPGISLSSSQTLPK